MKFQHLRFLVAVVDYGSVIKAAERLHISQPSISAGLKALEEELGGALFDRSQPPNRPLRLTSAGRRFYHRALEILNCCESARNSFRGEFAGQTAPLRVGVLDTLPQSVVGAVYRLFGEREPGQRLDLWEGSAERVAGWFAQGRVAACWNNVADLTPHAQVLWREALVAVLAPSHPLAASNGALSLRDLAGQPFIHRSRCELDAAGRAQFKAAGIKLDVRVRAERDELAFQLVLAGHAITLAPQGLVPPGLTTRRVLGLSVERSIGLQWREDIEQPLLAALISTIQDAHDKCQSVGTTLS